MNIEAVLSFFPSLPSAGCHRPAILRAGRTAAFTLVELLVTMVVGTILIVFLFQLFSASMKAWRQGEDQVETFREARAALQLMVRDLSQTIAPMTASPYVSPTPAPSAAAKNIAPVFVLDRYPDPAHLPEDDINEEVYCLTTIANNGASQLCAVGYFCAWKPDLFTDGGQKARAPRAYSLMRQYLGSGAPASGTTAAIPGLYDRFAASGVTSPLTFLNVFERATPPQASTTSPPQSQATELASYIWDLQIRTSDNLKAEPGAFTTAYPKEPKYMSNQSYANALPAYVEVRFKALSESAARQLEGNDGVTRGTWNDSNATSSGFYRNIILPGTRQFSARVPIYSGSATATPSP